MTYEEYDRAIDALCEKINNNKGELKYVFGIPRGGYYPAIMVSRKTGLELTTKNPDRYTLVVDDICDSGQTMARFTDNVKASVFAYEHSIDKVDFFAEKLKEGEWINFPDETDCGIEEHIIRILEYIGENPNRPGLIGTPDRIVRMFKEMFRGYDPKQKPKITVFDNGNDGITYDNMVIDKGDFYSACEHHMRTFFGEYYFAYIPNPKGKILGLSKIGRVVDYCSSKLQIQERLVHEIVDMLSEALGTENPPLGMALVMRGRHMCKESRGARKKGYMVSSYLTGCFKDEPQVRAEFMNFIPTNINVD